MFQTLDDAIALAEFAHRNQVDQAGFKYIEHPKRVLAAVQAQGVPPYVQIAAILHDVTEDTPFTHTMLTDLGFSEAAVKLVRVLDRVETNEWYDRYNTEAMTTSRKDFYYDRIKMIPEARIIKLADIDDNMQPWRLAYFEKENQDRKIAKYTYARAALSV